MPHRAEQQAKRRTAAERKLVSVMFADIVGSSAMVSGRDPEDADRALREVLSVLTGAVERYEGTVGQMLGDGLLAIFGAPNALEDHALRACLAAQDIRAAAAAADSGFAVRIGIASGEVLAQIIENSVWSDYRTVGECVHLAAKLQQRAEPNGILLSHHTVELVPVGLTVQPAGVIQLAPDTEPFPAFSVSSVRARRRTAADMVSSASGPFLGRRREQETLLAAFEAACDGIGTVVLMSGEAGIGKSRLMGETIRAAGISGPGLLQWPQAPIRRLGEPEDLERVAASLLPLAGNVERLCETAEQVAGPLGMTAMRDLLGLPVDKRLWDGLQPAERLSAAIDGLAATIVALSRGTPILVLVEDVHWAGAEMRRLLDTLTQAVAKDSRILFVATMRPDTRTGWSPDIAALRIPLEALPPEPVQEFLDRWLGSDPSLAEIKEMVTGKSQGVPLYLEESLRALETAGAITGMPGCYRCGTIARRVELPASVHGLLAARIDSLSNDARRALLTAAVIGPTVDLGLLDRMEAVPRAELPRCLAALEESGFLRRSRLIPNLEYSFRHGLIQEVAYATITRADRRILHANVVEALCERRDHDLPGRLELLAHHAFQAENWPSAYMFGRRAGQRAVTRSRLVDASQYCTDALSALDQLAPTRRNALRRIDLSITLSQVLLPRGVQGVDDQLGRARELALQVGDPLRFARAASIQAAFEWAHGDVDVAVRLSREALDAIGNRGGLETRIPLLLRLGGILAEKGYFAEARDALEQAHRLILADRPQGHYGLTVSGIVAGNCQLARCLAEMGDAEGVMRAGTTALDEAEESGHTFSKVYASGHIGWALLLLGDIERSQPMLERALTLCDLARSNLHRPFILGALGYAQVLSGQTEQGLKGLEQSVAECPKVWSLQAGIWNAAALLHVGERDRALAQAQIVWQRARQARRLGYEARAAAVFAESLTLVRRRNADAIRTMQDAEALARRLSMARLAERCARNLRRLQGRDAVVAR